MTVLTTNLTRNDVYACWNRIPITTFGAKTCQYVLGYLGKADPKCLGCKESKE